MKMVGERLEHGQKAVGLHCKWVTGNISVQLLLFKDVFFQYDSIWINRILSFISKLPNRASVNIKEFINRDYFSYM